MKKSSSFRHIFAEALIMLNFLALVAGLVMIPLLEPTPLSIVGLGLGLILSIVIAFTYGSFIANDKLPLGERFVAKWAHVKSKHHDRRLQKSRSKSKQRRV